MSDNLHDRIAAVIADCRVFDEQTHMTSDEIADAVIAELGGMTQVELIDAVQAIISTRRQADDE